MICTEDMGYPFIIIHYPFNIVETKFRELAMSLLDFSPRIPLGTFSILHSITRKLDKRYIVPSNQILHLEGQYGGPNT